MVAFSALSTNTGVGFANTYAHTPSGTPRGVVVVVFTGEAITGVTYGGQAMQAGTPVQGTSGPFATLSAHIYTLTSGVPTGAQNVVVSGPANNTAASYCFSVTAAADTEILDVIGLVGNVANPSGLLELGGREAFCALALLSDQDAVSGIAPLAGWTARDEFDAGVIVLGAYTYDTIDSEDVTAGWTQTADDVLGVAFAIGEVVAVEPDTVAAGFTAVPITSFPSSITEGDAPSTVAAGFTEVPVTSFPALVIDVAALRWITLGDSQTDEYKADDNRIDSGPWRPFVLNWLEQLAAPDLGQPYPSTHHRGLDIGAWGTRAEPRRTGFERNLARSGSQMDDVVADQLALAESIIGAGEADIGVLFGTGNEWGNPFQTPYLLSWIYNGNGTLDSQGVPVTTRMETVYGYYDTVMSALAPILPVGLVVVMPPDYGAFPMIVPTFPDATRRGYVSSAIAYLHGLIEARAEAINVAEGRTAVVTIPYDHYIKPDIWDTADGTYVTVAGVQLDYTTDSTDGNPFHFNVTPQTAIPHAHTIPNGIVANTVITAVNQLPGVAIPLYSDAEILENAGLEPEPPEPVELELIGGVEAGAEASLRVMRPLALEGGAAAGAAAALLVTRTLGIDAGATTGAETQLQVTRRLEGAAGADAGADASLQVTRRMTVEAGAEAGGQASLQITRALTVEGGAITGADASLQAVRRLQLIGGATAGLDARFASAPGELSLEGGASVGAEVTLRVGRRLAMEGGAAAGGAAELRVTRILALEAGAIAGVDVAMDASVLLSLIGGASAGAEVSLRVTRRLSAEGGAIAGVTVEFLDTDWHVPPSRTFAAPGPAIVLSGPGPSLTLR